MNSDIERVAEAIMKADQDAHHLGVRWSVCLRMAQAAVDALGLTEERAILGHQQIGPYVGDTVPVVVLDDARATHTRLVGPWRVEEQQPNPADELTRVTEDLGLYPHQNEEQL